MTDLAVWGGEGVLALGAQGIVHLRRHLVVLTLNATHFHVCL